MYDPKVYWQSRGYAYKADSDVRDPIDLAAFCANYDVKNILEVGSGYGRMYMGLKRLLNIPYEMCDIADSMIEECHRNTGIMAKKYDGITLPYEDKTIDCVISVNVALHVPPDKIEHFIAEHFRVANRYVWIASGYHYKIPLRPHVFDHDMDKLLEGKVFGTIERCPTNKIWMCNA